MSDHSMPANGRFRLADIPVRLASGAAEASPCEDGGVFALQVLGNDMAPEFADREIIVVEVAGQLKSGAFVVARSGDSWVLRELVQRHPDDGGNGWFLVAKDPAVAEESIADLSRIRGVVIQKSSPGRRRSIKRYD